MRTIEDAQWNFDTKVSRGDAEEENVWKHFIEIEMSYVKEFVNSK